MYFAGGVELNDILKDWGVQMAAFRLPRWAELPDMDLYMDQVISQLDKYLAPLQQSEGEHFATASMVNNYVKQQLLAPPVKKRYSRIHLAHLVIICVSKQVLTIPEVKTLIDDTFAPHKKEEGLAAAYDAFCTAQENAFAKIVTMQSGIFNGESSLNYVIDATVLANAGKTLAQKIIREKQKNTAVTVKVEKKKEKKAE